MNDTNTNPTYEKDGQGNFTQKGFLDRERDRAQAKNISWEREKDLAQAKKISWENYVEVWKTELSGYAFPQVPIKNEKDMQIFIAEMITAIAKMFTKLDGKTIGYKYEVAKKAYEQALNFMGELGY